MDLRDRAAIAVLGASLSTGLAVAVVVGLLSGQTGLVAVGALVAVVAGLLCWGLHALWLGRSLRDVQRVVRDLSQLVRVGNRQRRLSAESDLAFEVATSANRLLDLLDTDRQALDNEARLRRQLLEQVPHGVMVVGPEGVVRMANPAFLRLVPVRGAVVGRHPIEVVQVPEVLEALDDALNNGTFERRPCVAGARDLVLRPVALQDGGVLLLAEDVSEFRSAERARTRFVANVSHELRTPMATILGWAELLEADIDRVPEDLHAPVAAIRRNGVRLRDLFESLLELSRIEARSRELPLEHRRLQPMLAEAVVSAADRALQRKQAFSLHCDSELMGWVNPEAMSAMIGNLAANASAYTPAGGEIVVRARRSPKGEVSVQVQDSGIGIDPRHHDRIFERFYRVDDGRAREVGGTGLGLAIVKHLALAASCRLSVESAVGQGTTFTIHLPDEQAARLHTVSIR